MTDSVPRRAFGAAALAATGLGGLDAKAQTRSVLRVVPSSDLTILDPIWTTAYIVRTHGFLIYDTLFAIDANDTPQPMMVESWTRSDDELSWTFKLRAGLEFHDGQPVTGDDVIASLRRWGSRDTLGGRLLGATEAMESLGAEGFRIRLKEPFGRMLDVLGKTGSRVPFIMPARVAATPGDQRITETIGSGPFIFRAAEWRPGVQAVYERNPRYRPRAEPPSGLAGGKVAKVDRIEWRIIPDPATASAALASGEVDMIESPLPDLLPALRANRRIAVFPANERGGQYWMRFNHLVPPFDDVRIRRAAMLAIGQEDILLAQLGEPELFRTCNSPIGCGTSLAKEYGDLLLRPNLVEARRLLQEAGYDGRPIAMLNASDHSLLAQVGPVVKSQLEQAGFRVDLVSLDWQTVVARRAKKEPVEQGGWNIFFTWTGMSDITDPGTNGALGGSCERAYFGWPCDTEQERLREAFLRARDDAERRQLAIAIQDRAVEQASFAWLGEFRQFGAYRRDRIQGWLTSEAMVFWNISRLS
ncbi:ABC transporter substrate-binding protein [Roseococcus sp.]|uniref:ABC transporter substrate-binding protein n=1 Tax=Roseococcus sp. TaxID=2109646 RepID=UPI003BAD44FD